MAGSYDKARKAAKAKKDAKENEVNKLDEAAHRVVQKCKDRLEREGYVVRYTVHSIDIFYHRDYKGIDVKDEYENWCDDGEVPDDYPILYDENGGRLLRFSIPIGPDYKHGFKLNKFSGKDMEWRSGIETRIDPNKKYEDELLRIIAEFLESDESSAASNARQVKEYDDRLKREAKKREQRQRETEEQRALAAERKKRKETEEAELKKKTRMWFFFVAVILVTFYFFSS